MNFFVYRLDLQRSPPTLDFKGTRSIVYLRGNLSWQGLRSKGKRELSLILLYPKIYQKRCSYRRALLYCSLWTTFHLYTFSARRCPSFMVYSFQSIDCLIDIRPAFSQSLNNRNYISKILNAFFHFHKKIKKTCCIIESKLFGQWLKTSSSRSRPRQIFWLVRRFFASEKWTRFSPGLSAFLICLSPLSLSVSVS